MPWGRLDDSLYDHPKLDALPAVSEALDSLPGDGLVRLAAIGLWARAISFCNRFLTDGLVPRDRIVKLDGSRELADLLVAVGLFEPTSTGYVIHDFLQFNDSREAVLERRAKEAARKAEWRRNRDANRGPAGTDGGTASQPKTPRKRRPAGTDNGTPSTDGANVPQGLTVGHDDDAEGVSRDSTRARAGVNPDPSRPDLLKRDTTPQPPASGGRVTRRQAAAPMRSPTRYDDVLERDDLSDLFAPGPEPAEVAT